MRINHNIAALNTYRQLTTNNASAQKSMGKLSSGLRVNTAADDAAGLAISEKMRGQVRGLDQASRNAQDGVSLIQTAEGALNETHAILQRMRELAVQSSNDTNTDSDRVELKKEVQQLTDEIDRISTTTEFNTKTLLNGNLKGVSGSVSATYDLVNSQTANAGTISAGSLIQALTVSDTVRIRVVTESTVTGNVYSVSTALNNVTATILTTTGNIQLGTTNVGSFSLANFKAGETITFSINGGEAANTSDTALRFHIGANTAQEITVGIKDMSASGLGIKNGTTYLTVDNQFGAEASISRIDNAMARVSAERSKLGALTNRLEHTIKNLGASSENLTAAESRIRDVDMAKEMMEFTKNNILSQAAQSMLAQANQQPQGVLQLLR